MAQEAIARRRSDELTNTLRAALREGEGHLALVPRMVAELIEHKLWQDRPVRRGRIDGEDAPLIHFKTWTEFVHARPPAGLGEDPDRLRAICKGTEAEHWLAGVMGPGRGARTDLVDIIHDVRPTGTSRARAHRRLQVNRPDLYARVLAGELSPHAAMVAAGFRRHTLTIPDDPACAVVKLIQRYGYAKIHALVLELGARGQL